MPAPIEQGDDLAPQRPEGPIFIPNAGCRQPPIDAGNEVAEGEDESTQCPEGVVFRPERGECAFPLEPADDGDVQEGEGEPLPIVPPEEQNEHDDQQEEQQPLLPLEEPDKILDPEKLKDDSPLTMCLEEMNNQEPSIIPDELEIKDAPIAISGDNIYIVWWTNTTGSNEVMFRASADNGQTFSNKINLSNSTYEDSRDAQLGVADGGNVIDTWWETNQTNAEPVMRISTDNGVTFGQVLKLGDNGTVNQ